MVKEIFVKTSSFVQHLFMQLTIKGGIMLVCTQKQNFTHEIQSLVVMVNQDSTQDLRERVEIYLYL